MKQGLESTFPLDAIVGPGNRLDIFKTVDAARLNHNRSRQSSGKPANVSALCKEENI